MLAIAGSGLDEATALRAARDLDWQVRRVAVAAMSPASGPAADAIDRALHDPAFQVRLEAVRVLGRYAPESGDCRSLIAALDDRSTAVAIAALDGLTSSCGGKDDWLPRVVEIAATLDRSESWTAWHVPARALAAIARVRPAGAPAATSAALEHPVWQVRATAVEVARALEASDIALALVEDRHPNVRAAALDLLRDLDSPARFNAALEALRSADFHLMLVAARALAGAPDRDAVVAALIQRLNELGYQEWDTSREARIEMIERLAGFLDPSQASSLSRYIDDFDPRVSLAASVAFMRLTGTAQWPEPRPRQRYPYQPALEVIASLPRHATIRLEGGGVVEIEFLLDMAPVAVARFAELVKARYYDGLTFHRVDPNFAVHGGSPGENEFSGISRYIRDEPGAPHVRGAVGMATRSRDTGDGRFFIDLIDNPNLDGDYTVFARVISGMAAVDAILPGARIEAITLR
jgi:cyclophilin family peptidyl-prolyl cis-trans isomerase/HEAT repeat protein